MMRIFNILQICEYTLEKGDEEWTSHVDDTAETGLMLKGNSWMSWSGKWRMRIKVCLF
jgi:hypothetical protein